MDPVAINENRSLTQNYAYFAIILLSAFIPLSVYLVNSSVIKNYGYEISNEHLINAFEEFKASFESYEEENVNTDNSKINANKSVETQKIYEIPLKTHQNEKPIASDNQILDNVFMQKAMKSIEYFLTEDIHEINVKEALSQLIDLRKQEVNIQSETLKSYKERLIWEKKVESDKLDLEERKHNLEVEKFIFEKEKLIFEKEKFMFGKEKSMFEKE